jgi:hypothetical protein
MVNHTANPARMDVNFVEFPKIPYPVKYKHRPAKGGVKKWLRRLKRIWRDWGMDSEKDVALYYPYIDIDDAGLIKTAALYWDELQTIVPETAIESLFDEKYLIEVEGTHKTYRIIDYDLPIKKEWINEIYKNQITKEAYDSGFLKPRMISFDDKCSNIAGDEFAEDIKQKSFR